MVRTPLVTSTSLRARGTPASGPSRSPRSLAWSTARGGLERLVAGDGQEGVQPLVGGRDPLQGGLGGLDGGGAAVGEPLGQLVGGQVGQPTGAGVMVPPR